jgi:hypothetical protein
LLAVLLWWQEDWLGRRLKPNISNKVIFPSPWRLVALALYRSAGWSAVKLFVGSSWWWRDGGRRSGEAFFNKWWFSLPRCGGCLLLLPFSGHGGAEGVWESAPPCWIGEDWGDPSDHELIQASGISALAISRRHGGGISTSVEEAFVDPAAEARRHLAAKWFRPRWPDDGRWQKVHVGREPASYLLSFLGGDAWRTPTFCGGGTLVLDCLVFVSFRVFFVICKPLSSNTRFLERVLQVDFCKILYLPP